MKKAKRNWVIAGVIAMIFISAVVTVSLWRVGIIYPGSAAEFFGDESGIAKLITHPKLGSSVEDLPLNIQKGEVVFINTRDGHVMIDQHLPSCSWETPRSLTIYGPDNSVHILGFALAGDPGSGGGYYITRPPLEVTPEYLMRSELEITYKGKRGIHYTEYTDFWDRGIDTGTLVFSALPSGGFYVPLGKTEYLSYLP